MTNIDQFESVFKSADKTPFHFEPVGLKTIQIICDLPTDSAEAFTAQVKDSLAYLTGPGDPPLQWNTVAGKDYNDVESLLARIVETQPDLICAYRNLHSTVNDYPYSLGAYVDVLSQVAPVPLLLLPRPDRLSEGESVLPSATNVMAITDHLAGDDRLVNYSVTFTADNGQLILTHMEDEAVFERYIVAISKIPSIDTENARESILEKLLQQPRDYIESCRKLLSSQQVPIKIEEHVSLGHHLANYEALIEEEGVNLVVMNTKDDDQLAMHGLAYPLAIELRDTPLLLL